MNVALWKETGIVCNSSEGYSPLRYNVEIDNNLPPDLPPSALDLGFLIWASPTPGDREETVRPIHASASATGIGTHSPCSSLSSIPCR